VSINSLLRKTYGCQRRLTKSVFALPGNVRTLWRFMARTVSIGSLPALEERCFPSVLVGRDALTNEHPCLDAEILSTSWRYELFDSS
jgi:hypothetical protein